MRGEGVRSLAAVVLFLLFLAARPGGAADLAEIRKAGKLRVLVGDALPEFFSFREGQATGLDAEILDGFAKLHRVDLAVTAVPASVLTRALAANKGDVAAGALAISDSGSAMVKFVGEVLPTRYVIVTRAPRPAAASGIPDVAAGKIAVARGTRAAEILAALTTAAAPLDVEAMAPAEVLVAVKSGAAAAAVVRLDEAVLAQATDPAVRIGARIGGAEMLSYAVRKEDVELEASLAEYVRNLRRSTTFNRLVLKYFRGSAIKVLHPDRIE